MKKVLLLLLFFVTTISMAQPANNECANSENIIISTLIANTYTAITVDATDTVEGSCESPGFIDPDVWFDFTMPVNGNLSVTGITNNDYINIYASCGGAEIACFFNDGTIYGLEAGQDYILKFARFNNGSGNFDFTVQAFEEPANNECANSETIVISEMMSTTYTANTSGASETIEASCESPGVIDPDVWFDFTMPIDGTLFVSNNSTNNYITIYDSCGGTEIACFFGNSSVYNLTGGTDYILRFARFNNGNGMYDFTMQAFETPDNDLCASSETIVVSNTTANTYTANTQGASDTREGSCENTGVIDPDVWYNFIMPVTGNLSITNISNNDYINIYASCGGAEIACFFNDGIANGLNAGQEYILKFARFNNGNGMYNFTIQATEIAANDDCATAEVITFTPNGSGNDAASVMSLLSAATDSGITGTCDPAVADVDVWYEFTMPTTGNIYFSGLFVFDQLTLYSACDATTEVVCRSNNGFFFGLMGGTTYKLRHSIRVPSAADKILGLEVFPEIANDECATPEAITFMSNGDGHPSASMTSQLANATEGTIIGTCDGAGVNPDVWYEFTMPVNGNIYFSGLFVFDKLTLYTACDTATEVVCRTGNGFFYSLNAGDTFLLRHSIREESATDKTLGLEVFEEIANDECTAPEAITFTPNGDGNPEATVTSQLANATAGTITSTCDDAGINLDVWYEFTIPVTGNVGISGLFVFDRMTLYSACDTVNELDCFSNNGFFDNLIANETYLLRHSIREQSGNDITFTMEVVEGGLENDECATAASITVSTSETLNYTTDFGAATESDPAFVTNCETNASQVYRDVFWKFTMPVDGNIEISSADSTESFTLYDTCGGTEIVCGFGNEIFYSLTMGTEYIMRHAERDINADVSSFNIQAFAVASNDACTDRETITVTTTETNNYGVDFRTATEDDPSFVTGCETTASQDYLDVWWEFVMPVDGNIEISSADSSEGFTLYDMCGGTEIVCGFGDEIFYNLTMGTTYVLRHSERDINADVSSFNIQAFAVASNDACADRETIIVTTTETNNYGVDFRTATEDDPSFVTGCETTASQDYLDVWWEFVMPVDGNIEISSADNSEGFTLYDMCGGTEIVCGFGDEIFYNLTMGTTYVLRHSERDINADVSSFNIQAFAAASNDACADRETIIVTTTETNNYGVDFRTATEDDPSLVTGCETNASQDYLDVWWEFVMPVDGNIVISSADSSEGFTLYNMCGGTEIDCGFGNEILFNLTMGTTYVLRHSERDINADVSSFNIQAFLDEPNDDCANASVINLSTLSPTLISTELRGASEDDPNFVTGCETNASQNYLDVWYDLTMPVDGEIQVNNVSNSMSISFYDACGGAELTCFFNDGSIFNISAGTALKMRAAVRETNINTTPFTFDVIVIPNPLATCSGTTEFMGGVWNNGAPDNTMNAIIRSNYNTSAIDPATSMPYGNIEACSVSVDVSTSLTIAAGDYLEVTYGIVNNGTINVEHQGSVLQQDAASVVTNSGTINVDVTTPNLNARDFMVMGSPMTAETREDAFGASFRVMKHTTANFVPDATVAAAFPMAENFADDNGDNWAHHTGTITQGEGYLVWPQPNLQTGGTYTITHSQGTLTNGDVLFPVVFNTDKNGSPNMLANPYASAILADDFINANTMVDEVYFWEHLTTPSPGLPGYNNANFSMEDISMYNLMGGVKAPSEVGSNDTEPNGFISTGQGFGIKANAAGTALFSNDMRRLTGNTTLRSPDVNVNKLWLEVTNEDYRLQSTALIGFSNNTTAALDAGYDSRRLASFMSLYSHLEDGSHELAIQSRESFDSGLKVPVGFSTQLAVDNAVYTISLGAIEGEQISGVSVYLLDQETEQLMNLSDNDYTFTANPGSYSNRFVVLFEDETVLGIDTLETNAFVVYPNPANEFITVATLQNSMIEQITIIDQLGRVVISNVFGNVSTTKIDVSSLASGTYHLKMTTNNTVSSKRFIKE